MLKLLSSPLYNKRIEARGNKFGWTTGSQGSKREKFPNRPNSIVRDLRKADGKSWDEQVVRNVCLRCDADDILKIDSSTAGEAPRT